MLGKCTNLLKFKVGMFAFALMLTLTYYMIPRYVISPLFYYSGAISMFLISPVLNFFVSYFIGKRIVYKFGLLSAVIPLFLGSVVGSTVLFYYISLPSVLEYSTEIVIVFAQFFGVLTYTLQIFFVSFTAMTVGVLRRFARSR